MTESSDASESKRTERDPLSDADIALLCDISGPAPIRTDADTALRLKRLLAENFLEPAGAAQAPAKYQLTAKAEKLLAERGVGLNEA
jgi:hypothetical protein